MKVADDHRVPRLSALIRERPLQVAFALSLLLRLWMAFSPDVQHTMGDSDEYLQPGVNLFTHGVYALSCDPHCIPTLLRTPGYPIIVGLLVGGLRCPIEAVFVVQAIGGALATLLVGGLGQAIADRRTGIVAAFVQALNPFDAVFAGVLMTESLAASALIAVVYLLFLLREDQPPGLAWIALGCLMAFAALVRPVLAPLPAALALAGFEWSKWRAHVRTWSLVALGFSVMVAPWTIRNWIAARHGADDAFRVLASWTKPAVSRLSTPGLVKWYQSYEEPFLWDRPEAPPIFAVYFVPNEKRRIEQLIEGVRNAGMTVTADVDAGFDELAQERRSAHPFRTTVWAKVSRAIRLWVSPRLSNFGLKVGRLSGIGSKILIGSATAYNGLLAALGFITGFWLVRRADIRLLLTVPVYLTAIHAVLMWTRESRYTVPGVPELTVLAATGGLILLDRVQARLRLPRSAT